MKQIPAPQTVMITGASGTIGAALARAYARAGVHLQLFGRDDDRLTRVQQDCCAAGATVQIWQVELSDQDAVIDAIKEADDLAPIDLLIANAGVMHPPRAPTEPWAIVRDTFAINVTACLAMVTVLAERMVARGHGQIAIMSSVAGYRGLAAAPSYSASKAAVRAYGEAMRPRLAASGVHVSVICPGFVKSPLGDAFPTPKHFVQAPEQAAKKIHQGLACNKARIAFPLPMVVAMAFVAMLPVAWADALLGLVLGRR
jgi:short-subunit dehydrogenase